MVVSDSVIQTSRAHRGEQAGRPAHERVEPMHPTPTQHTSTGTSRRNFVKLSGVCLASLALPEAVEASAGEETLDPDRNGVLVDLTVCIGCRRCEWACRRANGIDDGPMSECDDTSVFDEFRRPASDRFTVVNRIACEDDPDHPDHVKSQCMHCEHPACASACLVGAMEKTPEGPVTYDASKCIGCRYCMVACPFQCAAYEYERRVTPRVRKCTLCRERTAAGKVPACVEICPVETLFYGKRSDLLAYAHELICRHPERYVDHVYGEHEVGGTSWLYLSDRPFTELGLPTLPMGSPAVRSETIQHGIFKGFAAPLLLCGMLAALNKVTQRSQPSP